LSKEKLKKDPRVESLVTTPERSHMMEFTVQINTRPTEHELPQS